jgi:hypothetical protein
MAPHASFSTAPIGLALSIVFALTAGMTVLAGCGSNGPGRAALAPVSAAPPPQRDCAAPDWAQPDGGSSRAYEQGIGSASTRSEASRRALEHLAGRLSTFVESRTVDSYQELDGRTRERLEQEIRTRVAGTRLEGWEEARAEERCGSWWVEVRIDRGNLVQSARAELDRLAQDVDLRLESADDSALRRLLALQRTAEDRERASQLISLIDVLDPDFDRPGWEARQASWRSTDEAARRSLVFEIRSDADAEPIADWIETRLVRQRLRMREGDCRMGDAICIDVRSKFTETYVVGRHIARVRATVLVLDPTGSTVQSGELQGSGQAKSDPALARRNALADLERRLHDFAILNGLL